jgi:hypothetical protein
LKALEGAIEISWNQYVAKVVQRFRVRLRALRRRARAALDSAAAVAAAR